MGLAEEIFFCEKEEEQRNEEMDSYLGQNLLPLRSGSARKHGRVLGGSHKPLVINLHNLEALGHQYPMVSL
jgi:hypothetical protein